MDADQGTSLAMDIDEGQADCDFCGEQGAPFICSGCRLVCYCTVDCQRKAWRDHKEQCRSRCRKVSPGKTLLEVDRKMAEASAANAVTSATRRAKSRSWADYGDSEPESASESQRGPDKLWRSEPVSDEISGPRSRTRSSSPEESSWNGWHHQVDDRSQQWINSKDQGYTYIFGRQGARRRTQTSRTQSVPRCPAIDYDVPMMPGKMMYQAILPTRGRNRDNQRTNSSHRSASLPSRRRIWRQGNSSDQSEQWEFWSSNTTRDDGRSWWETGWRTRVEDIEVGSLQEGRVTNVTQQGMVFIDIGAEKDGLLVPRQQDAKKLYREGDNIRLLKVENVNSELGRVTLMLDSRKDDSSNDWHSGWGNGWKLSTDIEDWENWKEIEKGQGGNHYWEQWQFPVSHRAERSMKVPVLESNSVDLSRRLWLPAPVKKEQKRKIFERGTTSNQASDRESGGEQPQSEIESSEHEPPEAKGASVLPYSVFEADRSGGIGAKGRGGKGFQKSLSELVTGSFASGHVANISRAGSVFIDIGAEKCGMLLRARGSEHRLRVGDFVRDLRIANVDHDAQQFSLVLVPSEEDLWMLAPKISGHVECGSQEFAWDDEDALGPVNIEGDLSRYAHVADQCAPPSPTNPSLSSVAAPWPSSRAAQREQGFSERPLPSVPKPQVDVGIFDTSYNAQELTPADSEPEMLSQDAEPLLRSQTRHFASVEPEPLAHVKAEVTLMPQKANDSLAKQHDHTAHGFYPPLHGPCSSSSSVSRSTSSSSASEDENRRCSEPCQRLRDRKTATSKARTAGDHEERLAFDSASDLDSVLTDQCEEADEVEVIAPYWEDDAQLGENDIDQDKAQLAGDDVGQDRLTKEEFCGSHAEEARMSISEDEDGYASQ